MESITGTSERPKPRDLRTKEGVEDFMAHNFERLRLMMDLQGGLMLEATIIAMRDVETGEVFDEPGIINILAPDATASAHAKDQFKEYIRGMALRSRAIGILFCGESWRAKMTPEEEAVWKGRNFEELPPDKRTECVWAHLEHIAYPKTLYWASNITRDAEENPVLAPFVLEYQEENVLVRSRFQGLLSRKVID